MIKTVLDWPSVFDPPINKMSKKHPIFNLLSGKRGGVIHLLRNDKSLEKSFSQGSGKKLAILAKDLRPWLDSFMSKEYHHFHFTPSFAVSMGKCIEKLQVLFQSGSISPFEERFVIHVSRRITYIIDFYETEGILEYRSLQLDSEYKSNADQMPVGGNAIVSIARGQNDFSKERAWHASEYDEMGLHMAAFLGVMCALYIKFGEIDTNRFDSLRTPARIGTSVKEQKAELAANVTPLKSTWLNNIVASGPISVRGHFRLQPFGQGKRDRKLIYIDPYTKSGYNRACDRWKEMPTEA